METLTTSRLLLRQWRDEDLAPFAAMNADPLLVETLFYKPTKAESDAMVARFKVMFAERHFGLWAVEVPGQAAFIGAVGLSAPRLKLHFTPCVEVGWRLAPTYWGHGYATEAAGAALKFAFEHLDLDEVVSFTAAINQRSRRVMERLGMQMTAEDNFGHPNIPEIHRLRPHVLYRLTKAEWLKGN